MSWNGSKDTPNILLVMADQLVPFLTGPYGHPVVKTQNLDRLAERGICFDAAYSPCPLCAPARTSLMTGRYASRIRVYYNAAPLASDVPCIAHYPTNTVYETAPACSRASTGRMTQSGMPTRKAIKKGSMRPGLWCAGPSSSTSISMERTPRYST